MVSVRVNTIAEILKLFFPRRETMAAEENRFAVQERILRNKMWQDFSEIWCFFFFFNKTIIPLGLIGYEMIIANSALGPSLAIYHLISNAPSWNNC